jgi:hypothetical protein
VRRKKLALKRDPERMTYLSAKYKCEQPRRYGPVVLGFHSSNIHLLPGNTRNTRFSTWGTGVSNTLYFFFLILCQEFKLVKAGDWQNLIPKSFSGTSLSKNMVPLFLL